MCTRNIVYTQFRVLARSEVVARGRVINNVRLFEINFNEEGDCCDLDKHGVGPERTGVEERRRYEEGTTTRGIFPRRRQTRVNNARRWVNKINRPL